jgi:hypothetical protein
MTAATILRVLSVPAAIAVALVAAAILRHRQERRRAAQGRARPVPPAPAKPLTEDEWAAFNGCLFASHQHVDEPDYGSRP